MDAHIKIVTYRDSLAPAFGRLNYEWIARDYEVEEHDREILDNPFEKIIQPGGQIFFALIEERAVGTAALENNDPDSFELVKMAVEPGCRGLGIGGELLSECVRWARECGKKRISLDSNTRQAAAIALYRRFGFVEVPLDPNSPYARVNVRMELALPAINM